MHKYICKYTYTCTSYVFRRSSSLRACQYTDMNIKKCRVARMLNVLFSLKTMRVVVVLVFKTRRVVVVLVENKACCC